MQSTNRRSPERVATLILPQIDIMLQARATLIGLLDCDDSHTIAEQSRLYLRDFKIHQRFERSLRKAR